MRHVDGKPSAARISAVGLLLVIALIATGCTATATTVEQADVPPSSEPTVVPDSTTEPDSATEPAAESETTPAPSPIPTASVEDDVDDEASTESEAEGDGATDEPSDGASDGLVWTRCPGGECTTVTVPLDYEDPTGPTIDVAVARASASNSQERIGSLFVNFGGPGGESTSIFPNAAPLLGSVFERFDIVTWDPRGIGLTARLDCDVLGEDFPTVELDPSDGLADEIAEQEAEFAEVVECAVDSGEIINHLGTVNVARDMEQVRIAIGDEPMNYLGLSYGTQIGWVYATLFGGSVRSMILDGAVAGGAISATDFTTQLAAFQRTFDYFDDVCARESSCRQSSEGLAASVERIAAELDEDPIAMANGEFFGEVEFRQAVLFSLYQRPDFIGPLLTNWIDNADNGDPNGLLQLLRSGGSDSTPGGYQAVLCADGGAFPSAAGQEADYQATLAASETFGMLGEIVRCDLWPGETELPPEVDTSSAPTILVVGNTFDPATPIEAAVLLDQQLADSVLLTVDGGGHTAVLDESCAGEVAIEYVNNLIVPPVDTICFTPGFFGVELASEAEGVRIATVVPGSAAEAGGVLAGDLLQSVNGQPMQVPADIPAVRAETPTDLVLLRDGEEIAVTIAPAVRPWN